MRWLLAFVLVLSWGLAQAQAPNETPGHIGIWKAPGKLGDTGDATAPGGLTVEGPFGGPGPRMFDPRAYGAKCGMIDDSTAGLQAAVNAALTTGGSTVIIPCPFRINGQVNVGANGAEGGIRIHGTGTMYPPAEKIVVDAPSPGNIQWPPLKASGIVCMSTTAQACLLVNASGVEIDHISFGNIQPTPPSTGTWNPTVFPWVIGTQSNSGWQGLYLHDLTFTSTSKAIDIEGAADYHIWTGTQVTLEHIWCNPCLETGVRIHRLDNQLFASHLMFVPTGYYFDLAPLGAYLRDHSIGLDIEYSAAPQFHDLNFFVHKAAISMRNGDVTNNFGHLYIAMSAGQFTNVMFNQSCQAVIFPDGDGGGDPAVQTNADFKMTNVDIWADESGFECSRGKAIFEMQSNKLDVSLSHVSIHTAIDSFANVGCGQTGVNGCGGYGLFPEPIFRLADVVQYYGYGHWTTGASFIRAPSNATLLISADNIGLIRPDTNGGNLIYAGHDGTTACVNPTNILVRRRGTLYVC